jgi:hypothetical protein
MICRNSRSPRRCWRMMAQMPAARANYPPKASARITKSGMNLGNEMMSILTALLAGTHCAASESWTGWFTAISPPTSSNANAKRMGDNDLRTTSALPASAKHPANSSKGFLEPHSKCQFSDFRALAIAWGAVQEFLIRPIPIAHAATPKTQSASGFEPWADRASSATVAANQLRYNVQRSLNPGQCNVSHRAARPQLVHPRPLRRPSVRDSLYNNRRPVLSQTCGQHTQNRRKPLRSPCDWPPNEGKTNPGRVVSPTD